MNLALRIHSHRKQRIDLASYNDGVHVTGLPSAIQGSDLGPGIVSHSNGAQELVEIGVVIASEPLCDSQMASSFAER